MLEVNATLHTVGDGFYSRKAKAVRITKLRVPYFAKEDMDFGELCVFFDKQDWNCDEDGDIYTDSLFLKELKQFLTSIGLCSSGVGYSEHGMQSDSYVSLDVGGNFLSSWFAKVDVA